MKKLLSLLTLLLCVCSGAWAENVTLGRTLEFSSTPTEYTILSNENAVVTLADGTGKSGTGKKLYYKTTSSTTINAKCYRSLKPDNSTALYKAYDDDCYAGVKIEMADGYKLTINKVVASVAPGEAFVYKVNIIDNTGTTVYTSGDKSIGNYNKANATNVDFEGTPSTTLELTGTVYVRMFYYLNSSNSSTSKYMAPLNISVEGSLDQSTDPNISSNPKTITLKATESGTAVESKFTITGSYLTPGTYNLTVPSVAGLSVSPTSFTVGSDGKVNQEVTVSYSSTVNVPANTANITASVDGLALNVAVNYSASVVSWTLQSVSSETTWDWSKVTANSSSSLYADNGIKLTAESTPSLTTEFVMANYDGDLYTIGEGFDGTSIAFKGQYPTRRNEFCQNGTIKFNTTVPGTVEVKFSDTGSTASATAVKRYLVVNGIQTEFWASRANNSTEEGVAYEARANVVAKVPVPAGDVTITGTSAHIYNYVKFIPAAETTINLNAKGYATYSSHYDVTVSGAKAYTAALDVAAETITCTEIADGKVPAGAGVLLFGEANATVTLTPTTGVAALTGNDLKGTTKADGTLATVTDGANAYALSGDTFKKFTGTALTANKAYFEVTGSAPARLSIIFDEETTGIENANLNANLNDEVFDLQGRRVAQPTKGLYIVNGRKVIVR